MSLQTRSRVLPFAGVAFCTGLLRQTATAQAAPQPNASDPREVPVSRIKTPLENLPGVEKLPLRKEMPDVVATNGESSSLVGPSRSSLATRRDPRDPAHGVIVEDLS